MKLKSFINSHIPHLFIIFTLIVNCSTVEHSLNPETADFHYNRGLEFLRSDDTKNAEREFRFAIELDDHFAQAHLGLAIINYDNKDYSTSEHHVDKAIKLKKHWADAYLLKSKILFQKEQYHQALKILDKADELLTNGNGSKRKTLETDIYLWRGLCLKNMGNYDMAAIDFAAVLKLDPGNQIATHALEDSRLINEMTSAYPQAIKNIINKKAISRADWAELLMTGLLKNFVFDISKNNNTPLNLPDAGSNESIIQAVQWKLVNVYPDGEFKPDLDLSWAEIIISVKNILQFKHMQKPDKMSEPPFSDLPALHPLYDSAVLATSLGVFKNTGQPTYRLSQSVDGLDALHVIANLNRLID